MSDTDNTRPWWVQNLDNTLRGDISHCCTKDQDGLKIRSYPHKLLRATAYGQDINGKSVILRLPRRSKQWDAAIAASKIVTPLRIEPKSNRVGGMPATLECSYQFDVPDFTGSPRGKYNFVCARRSDILGGMNYRGGATKIERKRRRRTIRQRERALLQPMPWLGDEADFDLLPVREDARTIANDLS